MGTEPGGDCFLGAIRQDIYDLAPLEVDDERAVLLALTECELVNADDTRCWCLRQFRTAHQPQQGCPSRTLVERGAEPRTGGTADHEPNLTLVSS
jgi:hypothetical protein